MPISQLSYSPGPHIRPPRARQSFRPDAHELWVVELESPITSADVVTLVTESEQLKVTFAEVCRYQIFGQVFGFSQIFGSSCRRARIIAVDPVYNDTCALA